MIIMHDHTNVNGIKMRYCAICDHNYIAGTFKEHKQSYAHVASVKHREAMAKWYRANGY